jgi:hypothetical protein
MSDRETSRFQGRGKVHYNSRVRLSVGWIEKHTLGAALLCLVAGACLGQQAAPPSAQPPGPPATGARILLLPKKLVSGERVTLAVLDLSGRLTPGVKVNFSNGDTLTTDASGRALFVAPLTTGTIYASIEGRAGTVASTIVSATESPSNSMEVELSPRVVSLSDRLEVSGHGFCGDADSNKVMMGGLAGLVVATSPAWLAVVPPPEQAPGPASVEIACGQKKAQPFTVVFVNLGLEASSAPLAPGEHREVLVRIKGSTAKLRLEARNLAPDVAELQGGRKTVRVMSTGGPENVAKFELIGKKKGNFVISIRLVAPLEMPQR